MKVSELVSALSKIPGDATVNTINWIKKEDGKVYKSEGKISEILGTNEVTIVSKGF